MEIVCACRWRRFLINRCIFSGSLREKRWFSHWPRFSFILFPLFSLFQPNCSHLQSWLTLASHLQDYKIPSTNLFYIFLVPLCCKLTYFVWNVLSKNWVSAQISVSKQDSARLLIRYITYSICNDLNAVIDFVRFQWMTSSALFQTFNAYRFRIFWFCNILILQRKTWWLKTTKSLGLGKLKLTCFVPAFY